MNIKRNIHHLLHIKLQSRTTNSHKQSEYLHYQNAKGPWIVVNKDLAHAHSVHYMNWFFSHSWNAPQTFSNQLTEN